MSGGQSLCGKRDAWEPSRRLGPQATSLHVQRLLHWGTTPHATRNSAASHSCLHKTKPLLHFAWLPPTLWPDTKKKGCHRDAQPTAA